MRISNEQIRFMRRCRRQKYLSYPKTVQNAEEDLSIAKYLVSKGYLCVVEKKESYEYSLTQEGKAYLSEYERGDLKNSITTGIAVVALIVSIISMIK